MFYLSRLKSSKAQVGLQPEQDVLESFGAERVVHDLISSEVPPESIAEHFL